MFRSGALLLLLLGFTWAGTLGNDEAGESHVLVLDHTNFTEVVAEHPFIVVEFYAPWCGHCKHLAPEYEKAATALLSHDPPILLAKVDADNESNKDLAAQYGVQGFPTLKIIENKGANVRDYNGPRNADGIIAYLKRQSGPPSQEIASAEEGLKLAEEADILIVGLFTSYDSEEFSNFSALATELRADYDFAHTLDASLLPLKDAELLPPVICLFKKFDEGFNDVKEFSIEALKKFVDDVSIPYVVTFSQHDYLSRILSNPSDSKVFFFVDTKGQGFDEHNAAYLKIAQEYRGKGLRFVLIDLEEGENALEYFGLKRNKLPAVVLQEASDKKYILEEVEPSQLAGWVKDVLDGRVPEFFKSEPIPEKNDEPVKVVVRDTLEDIVLKSGKNVFLEFYAPWCGHCKRLAPVLDEVAVFFDSDPSVLIAKMDATANDVSDERFKVEGFPTLYFYSVSGKVIPYEGNRSKEDLADFIHKNKEPTNNGQQVLKETAVESELKDEL